MIAYDWRGQQVDPVLLLAKYRVSIVPGPSTGWHVVEIRETSGRPELRNIVLGTRDPVAFDWLNIGATGLKSEMKTDMATGVEENTLNLGVNAGSYYWPGQRGPHRVKVQGDSDTVEGWGLAQDVPDQPPDPRYLTLQVVWRHGAGWAPVEPPVVPPVVPPPGNPGVNRADLLAIRANMVASRDAAESGISYIDRVLEGIP